MGCSTPKSTSRFYGDTDYQQKSSKTLYTRMGTEYRLQIYEFKSKKNSVFVGGSVETGYDIYQRMMKMNGTVNVGMEF